jgi:hypothetical protein
MMGKLSRVLLPILAVELRGFDIQNRARIETPNINTVTIRVRTRHVE